MWAKVTSYILGKAWRYLIAAKNGRERSAMEKPTFVSHEEKTADEFREAIQWLTEHGFKGHFYSVPAEVFDAFESLIISPGTDGFNLAVRSKSVDLWGPNLLEELTPKQRHLIREQFEMEPEEVCTVEREKHRQASLQLQSPLTKTEKRGAFELVLYTQHLAERKARDAEPIHIYMFPQVSPWTKIAQGVKDWRFDNRVTLSFQTKQRPDVSPISIRAHVDAVRDLADQLRGAAALLEEEEKKRTEKSLMKNAQGGSSEGSAGNDDGGTLGEGRQGEA